MSRMWFQRLTPVVVISGLVALSSTVTHGASQLNAGTVTPVTVGTKGNEPIVQQAPDGTLYISALQHLYRSTNGGATWTALAGPPEAQVNLNSDSSISVDPGGRLYFSFDYPYAGSTAVCTSDDKGTTFSCNPAVVLGGTDRMWVLAPSTTASYETTNEGLYETAFLVSQDRGTTYTPTAFTSNVLQPQTGPLLQKPGSSLVLQSLNDGNTNLDSLYVWDPTGASVMQSERSSPLPIPGSLPSDAMGRDGTVWLASEQPNPAGGFEVVTAYSADEGQHWIALPPIPQTLTGTATFTAVSAGSSGHVGVLYYYTTDNGAPGALNSTWSAVYAETYNATAAAPTWTTTTVDPGVHQGSICFAAGCTGTSRFSGDFITSTITPQDTSLLTWVKDTVVNNAAGTEVRFAAVSSSPTAARVSNFAVKRLGANVLFRWHLANRTGVVGFDLYARSHRLTNHLLPVRRLQTYRYQTRWTGAGPFTLHLLLRDGHQIVLAG